MSAEYQLVMRTGPIPGKTFSLSKNEIIIGRDAELEVSVNDAEVSRNHVKLTLSGNTYMIEDLGSTNGTYVNENKISGQVALNSNDVIRMGDNVTMVFEIIGTDPNATRLARNEPVSPATQEAPPRPTAAPSAAPPAAAGPSAEVPVPPQNFAGQMPASPTGPKEKSPRRKWLIGCGVVLLLGICAVSAALWYIDSNFLWCDVFGRLIPNCP